MENDKKEPKIVHPKMQYTEVNLHTTYLDDDGLTKCKDETVKFPAGIEETRSWESKITELAIYYAFAFSKDFLGVSVCADILEDEIDMIYKSNTTIFHVKVEHIINKLAEDFREMIENKSATYINLIKDTIRRINYFCTFNKRNYLLEVNSEQCVEELSDHIINFSKSLEEMESDFRIYLPSTMYEIGCKYLDSNDVKGFKYVNEAANQGHIRAAYQKIRCLYFGHKEYQNKYQAFYEANELLKNEKYLSIHALLHELIGEMYYEGEGTKQDYNKALEYFKKAEKEIATAKYYIGLIYVNGYGVEKNKALGINYILNAAREGSKQAIDYTIDYIFKKDESVDDSIKGLDDLFDTEETAEVSKEKKKPSNEFQELREKFKEKFGEYPYSLEPGIPIEDEIAAIKECLEKGENIIMEIYSRKDYYDKKDALY